MIIISARKFRDNQNELFRSALSEEVILTTVHYGNFRLVPLAEGESSYTRPTVAQAPVTAPVSEPVQVPVERQEPAPAPSFRAPVKTVEKPVFEDVSEPEIPAAEDAHDEVNFVPEPEEKPISQPYAEEKTSEKSHGEVYVDPSLLTLEEFYKQEGIDIAPKRKGLFGKVFGK